MAETSPSPLELELLGIKQLLWGNEIKPDIFKRWSQGFYFARSECSALEQCQGGPCAIIAPVQAFIIKNLLLDYKDLIFRDKIQSETQYSYLITALCEILQQCRSQKYYIVYLNNNNTTKNDDYSDCKPETTNALNGDKNDNEDGCVGGGGGFGIDGCGSSNEGGFLFIDDNFDATWFHDRLKVFTFTCIEDAKKYYTDNIDILKAPFGILLFLYSVIATRGLEFVKSEIDTNEPLIDDTYGYGSQSLINLMITGRATTYVWDHEQDVGGLKLKGIEKQSQIGFITIMEHLRYCTVGSFYKNPVHPVWVLASDTHLTVLFSDERKLVSPETKSEQARRVFKSFDPDGNNFISAPLLQDVLQALDLVSDEPYVEIMRKKLDPENLGIILLNAFMDEFFQKEESSTPDMFTLVHYNGLAQSNISGQVRYHIGYAVLLESDLKSICESNPMLTVLQTKWPNIEVNWQENITPSLN